MKHETSIKELSQRAKTAMRAYQERHPNVIVDRDYFPFKMTEEWGECLQVYLMLTDRGRQKDKTKDEIKNMLKGEMADVLGFLLLFADAEAIDLVESFNMKWGKHENK